MSTPNVLIPDTNRERRMQLHLGLERLDKALAALDDVLDSGRDIHASWLWSPPGWSPDGDDEETALLRRVRRVIANIEYQDGELRRGRTDTEELTEEIRQQYLHNDLAPGLLAVSARLIERAREVNEAKAAIEPLITAMNKPNSRVEPADDPTGEHVGDNFLRYVLRQFGRSHLHLHRVKRRLLILDEAPDSVGFTWATLRRIERVTFEELRNRLDRLSGELEGDDRVKRDLEILNDLEQRAERESEPVRLAIINAAHTHPKANLVLSDGTRLFRHAVLPILYPGAPGQPLARANVLGLPPYDDTAQAARACLGRRLSRSDRQYAYDRPLLETLPIYTSPEELRRYRGPF